jgi:hypothetical protein
MHKMRYVFCFSIGALYYNALTNAINFMLSCFGRALEHLH